MHRSDGDVSEEAAQQFRNHFIINQREFIAFVLRWPTVAAATVAVLLLLVSEKILPDFDGWPCTRTGTVIALMRFAAAALCNRVRDHEI